MAVVHGPVPELVAGGIEVGHVQPVDRETDPVEAATRPIGIQPGAGRGRGDHGGVGGLVDGYPVAELDHPPARNRPALLDQTGGRRHFGRIDEIQRAPLVVRTHLPQLLRVPEPRARHSWSDADLCPEVTAATSLPAPWTCQSCSSSLFSTLFCRIGRCPSLVPSPREYLMEHLGPRHCPRSPTPHHHLTSLSTGRGDPSATDGHVRALGSDRNVLP